jgi:hypothetical protein
VLSQSVNLEVSADKAKVIEIVSKHIAVAPECACEIVKTAIKASDADKMVVASIVEAAITSAPAHARIISQCAIATAPDAASEIQALLAKLDPNSGESVDTSKSGKAPAEVAEETFNPLDFPGDETSTVGPRVGTSGPFIYLPPGPPFNPPPITYDP